MSDPHADGTLRYRLEKLEAEVSRLSTQVDRIESTLDQLRGARALLNVVVGTSIVGTVAALLSLAVALR